MNKAIKLSQEHDTHLVEDATIDSNQDVQIDYDDVASGPLYVDPRHKKAGHHYCFVSDKPGQIETYKRRGWFVITDEIKVGDTHASTISQFGSAVTVQSNCGQLLVFMGITDKLFDAWMDYVDKKSKQLTGSLGYIDGVPHQYQEINGASLGEYKITRS